MLASFAQRNFSERDNKASLLIFTVCRSRDLFALRNGKHVQTVEGKVGHVDLHVSHASSGRKAFKINTILFKRMAVLAISANRLGQQQSTPRFNQGLCEN